MANENKQKLMEDAEDMGLRAVMGSKFQDVSREPKASAPVIQKQTKSDPPSTISPRGLPPSQRGWLRGSYLCPQLAEQAEGLCLACSADCWWLCSDTGISEIRWIPLRLSPVWWSAAPLVDSRLAMFAGGNRMAKCKNYQNGGKTCNSSISESMIHRVLMEAGKN